jgi:outer membrane lipoprotein SlyB
MDNNPIVERTSTAKLHPLIAVAAVSVTAAALVGIGVMTGLIPTAGGEKTDAPPAPAVQTAVPQAAVPAAPPAQPAAPPPVPAPQAAPAPEPPRTASAPPPPRAKTVVREYRSDSRWGNQFDDDRDFAVSAPPVPPDYRGQDYRGNTGRGSEYRSAYDYRQPAPPPPPVQRTCRECGTIEAVRDVGSVSSGPGAGAVAGGIIGGVIGHQIGKGRGNDAATVLGAIGGAVAGNEIEKGQRQPRYEITVRMDDGSLQVLNGGSSPGVRSGERVRVSNGVASPLY